MPLPKERYCKIRAQGCQIKFSPTRDWQEVCNNPECQKVNRRRNAFDWRRQHPTYHKKYTKEYHEAIA